MASAVMPMIELYGIPRRQATHDIGDGSIAGLQQQVKVIGDKRPGKAASRRFLQDHTKAQQKTVPIGVIQKDLSPLDAAADDVVASTRGVYASLSWHDMKVATANSH